MNAARNPLDTVTFDGPKATQGYNLNKMCYSFNEASAREAFKADEAAYCDRFGLTGEQKEAILKRDILRLLNWAAAFITLPSLPAYWACRFRTSVVCRPA